MPVTTVRKENEGSLSLAANEHVHYFLTARGAQPLFNLACEHRKDIVRESQFPDHPKKDYDWVLSRGTLDAADDNYTVAMGYLVALEYTLRIEHHLQDHSRKELISDKDYASQKSDDFDVEIVEVFRA